MRKASVNIYKIKGVKENVVDYMQKDIMTAKDAAEIFKAFLPSNLEEYFLLICLNAAGVPVGIHEVAHGDLTCCPVHPREVFKRALINNANSIIIAHNHPSGNNAPSTEDIVLTNRLAAAGKIMGIKVLDHIIITDDSYYSLRSNNHFEEE